MSGQQRTPFCLLMSEQSGSATQWVANRINVHNGLAGRLAGCVPAQRAGLEAT